MYNCGWEDNLVNLLLRIIEGEKNLEKYRISLAEFLEFNPKEMFYRIDLAGKGRVTSQSIKKFLIENSIFVKDYYIQNFINFYEGNYKSKTITCLSISEKKFKKFILPKTEADLIDTIISREEEIKKNQSKEQVNFLSFEVEHLFSKLLEEEISLIENVSKLLDEFFVFQDFNIYSIIRRLDTNRSFKNYIDEVDIQEFLDSKGYNYSHRECKLVLLRLDTDYDSRITYEELKFLFKTHLTELTEYSKGASDVSLNKTSGTRMKSGKINKDIVQINSQNYKNTTDSSINKTKFSMGKSTSSKRFLNKEDSGISRPKISLLDFLLQTIKFEKILEDLRIYLSLSTDIIAIELFYLFDINKINKIDKKSFQKTLNKFHIFPTDEETTLIYRRYDLDEDGYLDLNEFSEMFYPHSSKEHTKIMKNRTESPTEDQVISRDSKTLLIKFFKSLLDIEVSLEENRRKLCDHEYFSAYEEFAKIKHLYGNKADKESIGEFFLAKSAKVMSSDVDVLIHVLDRDRNDQLSFMEFVHYITPRNLIFNTD